MRVLTVVQRNIAISEPWLRRMIVGLGQDCVGVAGRTTADADLSGVLPPFCRLRTRNPIHRILPKGLRKRSPLRPAAILADFATEVRADRVLCNYGTVAVEYREAWERLGLPIFVHFHGYDLMFDLREQDGSGRPIHGPGYLQAIRDLSKRAMFVANSSFSKSCLIAGGIAEDRITVNYMGVEPNPVLTRNHAGRQTILYVGRFVDCKGPDLTIKAFNVMRERGTDAKLVMVGDGPFRPKCIELAASSPFRQDICLAGVESLDAVRQRFRNASVFTMHSCKGALSGQEEAFGVAILDAMAAGLPVVTGRSGGVPEIVRHGETGYLFEPGDIDLHAEYLALLIRDRLLAAKFGEAGWRRVQSNFTQELANEGLRRILNAV